MNIIEFNSIINGFTISVKTKNHTRMLTMEYSKHVTGITFSVHLEKFVRYTRKSL